MAECDPDAAVDAAGSCSGAESCCGHLIEKEETTTTDAGNDGQRGGGGAKANGKHDWEKEEVHMCASKKTETITLPFGNDPAWNTEAKFETFNFKCGRNAAKLGSAAIVVLAAAFYMD